MMMLRCFAWLILDSSSSPPPRYALSLASRGAKLVINDLGPSTQDKSKKAADVVVEEITKAGGEAIANLNSNLEGDKIVKQAMDKWGRVDVSTGAGEGRLERVD
jgi:NAD(P)-dependent dehydrogenase (short-subunit alcohol dehydrogenase family)